MNRIAILLWFALLAVESSAQELFVYTEPASNIPSNVLSARLMSSFYKERYEPGTNIHFMPELRYGISSKLMVQGQGFISTRNGTLITEGGGLYAQYSF